MVKVFVAVHKLESLHAKMKEDTSLSEQEILENMLKEILRSKNAKLIAVLREGDSFGEQALVNKDNPGLRTASVKTKDQTVVVSFG